MVRTDPLVLVGREISLPAKWFMAPLQKAIVKVVRPAIATTRRKELVIQMAMPRQTFMELTAKLGEGDANGIERDPLSQELLPTKTTATLRHWEYTIRKPSVLDKLLRLDQTNPPPPPLATSAPTPALAQIGEEGVYEVEAIRAKRTTAKRTKYLIKWRGFPESDNTWEAPANINRALVASYEGRAAPAASPTRRPKLPNRGQGAARAFLTSAAQRRGQVPTSLSMVCGNTTVNLKESRKQEYMPVAKLTFMVMTMDNAGHITWPTNFATATRAALRNQVRALLRKMLDDPLNPCNETMAPALEGVGTSSVWEGAPRRQLVRAQPAQQ